jgi:MFS family permease
LSRVFPVGQARGYRDALDRDGTAGQRPGFALLLTLSMAQFTVVLDFAIVNVALPSIQHALARPTALLQWVVSGYAVTFGGFLLLGGRLADAYGRAWLCRIGLVLFAAAGFASGAILGGLLAELTWRLVFFVNVPVGVALLVASLRQIPPDPPRRAGQWDVPGAVTATAGVALLVLAVTQAGNTLRLGRPAVFGAAAVVVVLAVFADQERRAPAPLLSIGMAIAVASLVAAASGVLADSLLCLLAGQFGIGVAARLCQVSGTLAGKSTSALPWRAWAQRGSSPA